MVWLNFSRFQRDRPVRIFKFRPRWKEELVVQGPGGRFMLEFHFVGAAYLPTEEAWQRKSPEWARPLWPVLKHELKTWCSKNQCNFHIDETASVVPYSAPPKRVRPEPRWKIWLEDMRNALRDVWPRKPRP